MKTYSSVSIVLQVAFTFTVDTRDTLRLDSDAGLDLVIAGEHESTTRGMLVGGSGRGKVNVNRGLTLTSARLK